MNNDRKSTASSMVDYVSENSIGLLIGGLIVVVLLGALAFKDRLTGLPPDLESRSQSALDDLVEERQAEIEEDKAKRDEEAAIEARQTTTTFRLAEAEFVVTAPRIEPFDPNSRRLPPLGGSAEGGEGMTPTTDSYEVSESVPEIGSLVENPVEQTVRIKNRLTDYCLTASEELNVLQAPCDGRRGQRFKVELLNKVENGVRLRAGGSKRFVEVQRGLFNDEEVDGKPFRNISIWKWLGVELGQQVFHFRWSQDSSVRIEPAGHDRCVAPTDRSPAEWGNVGHEPCIPLDGSGTEADAAAQSWYLLPVD